MRRATETTAEVQAGGVDLHRGHVVLPRELAPGFWVAIEVEEDLEHARTRFLTPAVGARVQVHLIRPSR